MRVSPAGRGGRRCRGHLRRGDLGLDAFELGLPVAHVGVRLREGGAEDDGKSDQNRAAGDGDHLRRAKPIAAVVVALVGSRVGKKVYGTHLVLDSKSDCHCQRRKVVAGLNRVGDLNAHERIRTADAHAREALELFGKTGQSARPAREQDVRDRE